MPSVYTEDKGRMKKLGIFVLLGCMLFSGCGNKDSADDQLEAEVTPAITQAVITPAAASSDPGNAGDYDGADLVSIYK